MTDPSPAPSGSYREARAHLLGLTPDEILNLTRDVLHLKAQDGEYLSNTTQMPQQPSARFAHDCCHAHAARGSAAQ